MEGSGLEEFLYTALLMANRNAANLLGLIPNLETSCGY